MPFQSSWYVDKRVLYVELIGELTVEDLKGIVQMYYAIEETDGPLHSITDTSKMTKFPTNPAQLAGAFKGYKGNSTSGWSIILSNNALANFAMVFVAKFSDARYKTAHSVEDAVQFLSEIDPTLVPLLQEKQRITSNG
jgi:hypothetical protein